MTTTLRLTAEHLAEGRHVLITERGRGSQSGGIEGTRGLLVKAGESITLTVHDGNAFSIYENETKEPMKENTDA